MTIKDLDEKIKKLSTKCDRIEDLISDKAIEAEYKSLMKKRASLIENGCKTETLEAFDRGSAFVVTRYNAVEKMKKKLEAILKENLRLQREQRAVPEAVFVDRPEYNFKCRNFNLIDGEPRCDVKMDMVYCSNTCPYATNTTGSYIVDGKGKIMGTRK